MKKRRPTRRKPRWVQADAVIRTAQHKEMLSSAEVLDWAITNLPDQIANLPDQPKGGRQPITPDDVEAIKQAIAALKALPVTPKASDKDKARAAVSILKKIAERLGKYFDIFLTEALKELGKRSVQPTWWALWALLQSTLLHAIQSVTNWLQ